MSKEPHIKFIESILIEGSDNAIFNYTQDYRNRLTWDTFLKEAQLVDAENADKGVKAWCVAKNGLGMETIYVSFLPPRVAAMKMTRGPYMFKDFAASWRFDQMNENDTRVTFIYSFSLRFPFNIFAGIVRRILQKNVKHRLYDLHQAFLKNKSSS